MNDLPTATRRGFRIRWWMWPIALVALVLASAGGLRWAGQAQWRRVEAEIAAQDLPRDAAGLVATAPAVDPGRQDRLWKALQDLRGAWTDPSPAGVPFHDLDTPKPDPKREATRREKLAAGTADMHGLLAVLDEGPLELSSLGWMDRGRIAAGTLSLHDAVSTRLVPLLQARAAANWLGSAAVYGDDPAPHLAHLDALVRALHRPGTLIDAMTAVAMSGIRDEVQLYLATRGRLAPADLERWAALPWDPFAVVAGGCTGERCLFLAAMARARMGEIADVSAASGWEALAEGAWDWACLHRALAVQGRASLAAELGLLRHAPVAGEQKIDWSQRYGTGRMLGSWYIELAITAVDAAAEHRLRVAAGSIARAYRAGDPLPADATTIVPAAILAGGPTADEPPLLYERLGPARFRIGIDPHGTLPPAVPADRWKSPGYASAIGTPPSAKPSVIGRWSIEIDLEAILVPPPPPKPRAPKPTPAAPPP